MLSVVLGSPVALSLGQEGGGGGGHIVRFF